MKSKLFCKASPWLMEPFSWSLTCFLTPGAHIDIPDNAPKLKPKVKPYLLTAKRTTVAPVSLTLKDVNGFTEPPSLCEVQKHKVPSEDNVSRCVQKYQNSSVFTGLQANQK